MKVYNRKGDLLETVRTEDTRVAAYAIGYLRHGETLVKVEMLTGTIHYAYNNTKCSTPGPWYMFECSEEEFVTASNIIDSIANLMNVAPKEDIKALITYLKDRVKEVM